MGRRSGRPRRNWNLSNSYESIADHYSKIWSVEIAYGQCFACGCYHKWERQPLDQYSSKLAQQYWSQAIFMERCHLIPHAAGGSSDKTNIVILCCHCHCYQEGRDPAEVLEWLRLCTTNRCLHLPWDLPWNKHRTNYFQHIARRIELNGWWDQE